MKDFINTPINIIFDADEGRDGTSSALAAVPVIDDEINEATEMFVVQLKLVNSVDPSMITLVNPTASLCSIIDDDRKCSF